MATGYVTHSGDDVAVVHVLHIGSTVSMLVRPAAGAVVGATPGMEA